MSEPIREWINKNGEWLGPIVKIDQAEAAMRAIDALVATLDVLDLWHAAVSRDGNDEVKTLIREVRVAIAKQIGVDL